MSLPVDGRSQGFSLHVKWSLASSKWFLPPRCLPAGMDAAQEGVRETNRAANVGEELGYLGEPCAAPCYGAVMRSVAWPWPGLQVRLTQTSWHKGWCERLGEEGQGGRLCCPAQQHKGIYCCLYALVPHPIPISYQHPVLSRHSHPNLLGAFLSLPSRSQAGPFQ